MTLMYECGVWPMNRIAAKQEKKKTGLSIVLECEAITFLCDNVHIILRKFYEIT